jgi:ribose transport system substrate-binding protein
MSGVAAAMEELRRRRGGGSARRVLVVASAAVAAAALTAGCGSSDNSSDGAAKASSASTSTASAGSSPTAAVEALVAKYRKPSNAFVAPGPAVDASSLKGKTVWFIPLGAVIPALGVEAKGIQEAAAGLGITVKTCDGKLQPAAASSCISQATKSGADGILIDSVTPQTVTTALRAAEAKKIPVVQIFGVQGQNTAYTQYVSLEDRQSHAIAADWIIADSKGKANVVTSTSVGDLSAENDVKAGGGAEFASKCPDCDVTNVNITPTTVESLTAATSTALLKNPKIDYGLPEFDFLVPLFQRGVQQAGRTAKMKVVSTNGVLSSMQLVKSGKQAADGAGNRNYGGWQAMDAYVRLALGKPAPTKQFIPPRVFDATNIGTVSLTEAASKSGEWFGDLGYKQDFLKLWGAQ